MSTLKCDNYHKDILNKILEEGTMDRNPRPKYHDFYNGARLKTNGNVVLKDSKQLLIKDNQYADEINGGVIVYTPAHTISINHFMESYDLTKGEIPIISLRPIAVKSAIAELLWIYQLESNNLDDLEKLGVTWWDSWMISEEDSLKNNWNKRSIGCCYGETVHKHNLMKNLLEGIQKDPDGRRHIINMWQEDDFKLPHGLKPCCYQTQFSIVHGKDGKEYMDCILYQRSSDFCTAGVINAFQYYVLLCLVARHTGYIPRQFSVVRCNVQIYDRHIEQAKKLIKRETIPCEPKLWINPEKTNFYDMTIDDIKLIDYPRKEIESTNPQLKFQLGI